MRRGDCYEAAAMFVIGNAFCPGIVLAHGEVTGQGKIAGIRYGHAWVEIGDAVIDPSNGRKICMRRDAYYAIGKITGSVVRYAPHDARRMMLETHHYGPWEGKNSSATPENSPARRLKSKPKHPRKNGEKY